MAAAADASAHQLHFSAQLHICTIHVHICLFPFLYTFPFKHLHTFAHICTFQFQHSTLAFISICSFTIKPCYVFSSIQAKVEIHCHILGQKRAITTLFRLFGNQFMQNILPLKDFYASREGVHTKQIVFKWALLPGDHLSPLLIQDS